MSIKDVLGNISGFLTVVGAIFLLNAFRDMSISWRDISASAKKQPAMSTTSENDGNETHQLLESDLHSDFRDPRNSISSRGSV